MSLASKNNVVQAELLNCCSYSFFTNWLVIDKRLLARQYTLWRIQIPTAFHHRWKCSQ